MLYFCLIHAAKIRKKIWIVKRKNEKIQFYFLSHYNSKKKRTRTRTRARVKKLAQFRSQWDPTQDIDRDAAFSGFG